MRPTAVAPTAAEVATARRIVAAALQGSFSALATWLEVCRSACSWYRIENHSTDITQIPPRREWLPLGSGPVFHACSFTMTAKITASPAHLPGGLRYPADRQHNTTSSKEQRVQGSKEDVCPRCMSRALLSENMTPLRV